MCKRSKIKKETMKLRGPYLPLIVSGAKRFPQTESLARIYPGGEAGGVPCGARLFLCRSLAMD
jgi:hypothetical protein